MTNENYYEERHIAWWRICPGFLFFASIFLEFFFLIGVPTTDGDRLGNVLRKSDTSSTDKFITAAFLIWCFGIFIHAIVLVCVLRALFCRDSLLHPEDTEERWATVKVVTFVLSILYQIVGIFIYPIVVGSPAFSPATSGMGMIGVALLAIVAAIPVGMYHFCKRLPKFCYDHFTEVEIRSHQDDDKERPQSESKRICSTSSFIF